MGGCIGWRLSDNSSGFFEEIIITACCCFLVHFCILLLLLSATFIRSSLITGREPLVYRRSAIEFGDILPISRRQKYSFLSSPATG
jgi:hypothetical protein